MGKYVIYSDGYYFMRFADFPGFGDRPQWTPDLERAKLFDTEALAKECLRNDRFGDFRNRCEIQAV